MVGEIVRNPEHFRALNVTGLSRLQDRIEDYEIF